VSYADVIINNNSSRTEGPYTYAVPPELEGQLQPGDRVLVPFARRSTPVEAYVVQVMEELETPIKGLRKIASKDPEVSLTAEMLQTARWMEDRYFCRPIEALHCFAPAGAPSKRGKTRSPYKETPEPDEKKPLTEEQQDAFDQILPALEDGRHQVTVIHGVTGSGKTELYLQVIEACVQQGKKAILLVPEISLTPQTVQRFLSRFGPERVAVLHSKLSLGQRYDEWMRVRRGEVDIVVGARSAVFAPFENIGVIILDEEHEASYRSDSTPKYDAAEVAIERARYHGAAVLLGSATPSVGTSLLAEEGRFKRVFLHQRYNKNPLPEVTIADMRQELQEGNRTIFSRALFEEMEACLAEGKQVILFLNRRGYSGFLSCRSCGYVMKCPECGISLTYHKEQNRAVCHFCDRSFAVPETCPECGSTHIRHFGIGTEKVEEQVQQFFPGVTTARLDMDTARKKGSTETILKDFGKGKTQVLIGTQLVAKGLDFANVGLVGIVAADVSLNIPDFRAAERTFQLVTQAAGRSGRGDKQGKVVIQTYSPDHYAILAAAAQDYESFYRTELLLRKTLSYPPYSDLIQMVLAAEDENEARLAAEKVKLWLQKKLPESAAARILGPRQAPLVKAGGMYRFQLLLKVKPEEMEQTRKAMFRLKKKIAAEKEGVWLFTLDVNPYSYL